MPQLTHLDLFSGIGGFSLAAGWAGFHPVAFVERDDHCRKVLERHWSGVPIYDDIRTFDGGEYEGVDLLTAGTPCQPVSLCGKGLGDKDERWLWPDTFRVVRRVRPGYVVLENPTGLLGRGMGYVLGELAAAGFDAEWQTLPASAFGAFHERERVFILAYPKGKHGRTHDLLETSGEWRTQVQLGRLDRLRVAEAAKHDPNARLGREPRLDRLVRRVPGASHRLRAIGNSVYPPAAYPILSAIAQTLRGDQ